MAHRGHHNSHQSPTVVDESASLLATDAPVKKNYDQLPWYSRIVDVVTFERIKIFLILAFLLAAAIVFSLKKEEHAGHNLAAVSYDHPLISSLVSYF